MQRFEQMQFVRPTTLACTTVNKRHRHDDDLVWTETRISEDTLLTTVVWALGCEMSCLGHASNVGEFDQQGAHQVFMMAAGHCR